MARTWLTAATFAVVSHFGAATAQDAVYLIRHAEKAVGDNPPLTEAGRDRAARWAAMLADVGLDAIYTSDRRRTKETGGIVGGALGLHTTEMPASAISELVATLADFHEGERVLVVGHAETIPGILSALGHFDLVKIADDDFSNLYISVKVEGDEPYLIHLLMP